MELYDLSYFDAILKRNITKGTVFLKRTVLDDELTQELLNNRAAILTIYDENDSNTNLSIVMNSTMYAEQAIIKYLEYTRRVFKKTLSDFFDDGVFITDLLLRLYNFEQLISYIKFEDLICEKTVNQYNAMAKIVKNSNLMTKFATKTTITTALVNSTIACERMGDSNDSMTVIIDDNSFLTKVVESDIAMLEMVKKTIGMSKLAESTSAMDKIVTNVQALNKTVNSTIAMNEMVKNNYAMNKIFSKTTAVTEIIDNQNIIDIILLSRIALTELSNNQTALTKFIANSTVLDKILNSELAIDIFINNSSASTTIFNNSTASDKIIANSQVFNKFASNITSMKALCDNSTVFSKVFNNSNLWATVSNDVGIMKGVGESKVAIVTIIGNTTKFNAILSSSTVMYDWVRRANVMNTFYENHSTVTSKLTGNSVAMSVIETAARTINGRSGTSSEQTLYSNKAFLLKSKGGTDYSSGGGHMVITGNFINGTQKREFPAGKNPINYVSWNEFVSVITMTEKWDKMPSVIALTW